MVSPVLVILALAMLAGVAYMALARNSSPKLRIAALGALGIMVVTAIICSLVILKANKVVTVIDPEQVLLPDANPPVVEDNNIVSVVMLILFLVALFALVLVFALREQKRSAFEETDDKPFDSSSW